MYTKEQLAEHDIHCFIEAYDIKNEQGISLDFKDRMFLWDIYHDESPLIAVLKAPQIGMTVLMTIKSLWTAKNRRKDIIYTLPTQSDVGDMAGGKVNRIIAQNDIFKKWVKEHDSVEQKSVGDNLIYYRGCIDENTEVLTENGWCKLGQVNRGNRLPTLNTTTNSVEMDSVLDLSVFREEQRMVRIKSRQVDQLVTEDHRCVVSKRTFAGKKSPLRIVRAHELVAKTTHYIPMVHRSIFDLGDKVGDDNFYKILGWVIGDGSYWTKRDKYITKKGSHKIALSEKVCIIQSKFCSELEKDLADAGIDYHKKKHNGICFRYELNAKASVAIREIIPDKQLTYKLVFNASHSERSALLQGLMMSDGNNSKGTRFYQNQGQTTDGFQALLVLLGRTTTQRKTRKNITVVIKQSDYAHVKAKYVPYSGLAWCPTTKNGTIFIRRNGIVSVTGQTFTNKQAMMVSSQINIHDEVDASKADVITQYETRQQAQAGGSRWYFSHPTLVGLGVHKYYLLSDQKHWFIQCPHCKEYQYLSWDMTDPRNMSIDVEREVYVCKKCRGVLSDDDRRKGQWIRKYKDRQFSGYWISQLMCPWITASKICKDYREKTQEYFHNYVLGLPYAGSGNQVTAPMIEQNITKTLNEQDGRIIIGLDSGIPEAFEGSKIWVVVGNQKGIFYYGGLNGWNEVEKLMQRWPTAVVVGDQGGHMIGIRKLQEKFPNRVYLTFYRRDRKSQSIIKWGENEERGTVIVDRNKAIQLVIDEFTEKRLPLNGSKEDYHDYLTHWMNIYRTTEEDTTTLMPRYVWERNGPDHLVHATVYYRVGLDKFKDVGVGFFEPKNPRMEIGTQGIEVSPQDTTVSPRIIRV